MLPDYPKVKNELQQFFNHWLRERVQSHLGYIAEVPRYKIFEGTATSMIRPDGQEDLTPMKHEASEFQITLEEVPALTLPEILSRLDQAAQDMADKIARLMYTTVSNAADKVGNVVKSPQGFTPQVIFEILEKMEIPFDEHGNPELPSIHVHPNSVETLKDSLLSLQNDPGLRRQYNDILQQKKEQWRVREADRKLVG